MEPKPTLTGSTGTHTKPSKKLRSWHGRGRLLLAQHILLPGQAWRSKQKKRRKKNKPLCYFTKTGISPAKNKPLQQHLRATVEADKQ